MEQFQRDNALSRGYMTLESVRALQVTPIHCASSECPQAKSQTTVLAAQAALSEAGFFAAQDGIHGPQTQSALEQFQAENGLEIGYLSAETMHKLNILSRI
nr:peptidoglycan-binding protein [Alphaproteobacteria bacterium]